MAEPRADIYTRITAEIIAAIEAGAGHYQMPWHHNGSALSRPTNVISERRYHGANVLALWIAAEAAGYASGVWGTYRQWVRRDGLKPSAELNALARIHPGITGLMQRIRAEHGIT
jgi:antirestriction protein ArdC